MPATVKAPSLLVAAVVLLVSLEHTAARYRRQLPSHLSRRINEPNICAVQEISGTNQQYFPKCIARRVLRLCGRSTFLRLQCCPGYEKVEGEPGCTMSVPMENIYSTANRLKLQRFYDHASKKGFSDGLSPNQAYTIFAPDDNAFSDAIRTSGDVKPKRLLYHVVPGRLNFSDFVRNQEFVTLFKGKKIRVNKYPNGVATVNCARITRINHESTNGLIHVIDQVVRPYDGESAISVLENQPEKFDRFLSMIRRAGMMEELTRADPITIFAPTNEALDRLPSNVLRRLRDERLLKDFVSHHVVRKVICADAIVVSCGLTNLNNHRLRVSCEVDGHYVDGAKLVDHDLVADHGVVHAINDALLPDSVKDMIDLASDMKLTKFLDMSDQAGLTDSMRNEDNYTLFAPTDEAFKALSSDYQSALRSQPQLMKRLVNYHRIDGKVKSNQIVGQADYTSKSSVRIKVNVYRNGITVDDAKLLKSDRESGNGVIHTIDRVLIPPEHTLMGLVRSDPTLSQFGQALEAAGVDSLLESENVQLTVLAPTNDAFDAMTRSQLNGLISNPALFAKHLQHHVVKRLVVPCGLKEKTWYNTASIEGETLSFRRDKEGHMKVFDIEMEPMKLDANRNSNAMAVNGIIYKISSFLPCNTCAERSETSSNHRRNPA
ncbi:transforming growth factor-beta-induced protein ig-h3-like [Argonauta hians]